MTRVLGSDEHNKVAKVLKTVKDYYVYQTHKSHDMTLNLIYVYTRVTLWSVHFMSHKFCESHKTRLVIITMKLFSDLNQLFLLFSTVYF